FFGNEPRPLSEVGVERRASQAADGHDALFPALAEHAKLVVPQVDAREVEGAELAHAQTAAVEQLEHGAVARGPKRVALRGVGPCHQLSGRVDSEELWQLALELG